MPSRSPASLSKLSEQVLIKGEQEVLILVAANSDRYEFGKFELHDCDSSRVFLVGNGAREFKLFDLDASQRTLSYFKKASTFYFTTW